MNVAVDKGNVYFLQVFSFTHTAKRHPWWPVLFLITRQLIWLRLFSQVGRNIDIAFLVLCAHAMDQMFYDKDYD